MSIVKVEETDELLEEEEAGDFNLDFVSKERRKSLKLN
jgi:hypothetical protein